MMQLQVAAGSGRSYTRSPVLRPRAPRPRVAPPCTPPPLLRVHRQTMERATNPTQPHNAFSTTTLHTDATPASETCSTQPIPLAAGKDVRGMAAVSASPVQAQCASVALLRTEQSARPVPTSDLFQYDPFESTITCLRSTLPPLIPLPDLSPDRLLYLSALGSEANIAPYQISLSNYHRWLEHYPSLYSESGNLRRRFQCCRSPYRASNGEHIVSLNIKAMPSAYHDAIGRYVSRQTSKEVERVTGDPDDLGLSVGTSMEFVGFEGEQYDDLLAPTAAKVPDCAILPAKAEFPTVAVEVGFSESWEDLLSDAHLWLHGTKHETKAVLLFLLQEGAHVSTYSVRGKETPKSTIQKQKFTWPFLPANSLHDQETTNLLPKITLNDPHSPLLRMLNPAESSVSVIAGAAEKALREYYLDSNQAGTLLPPLVEPLDATVFLFRRKGEDASASIQPHEFDDPTPQQKFKQDMECHFRSTFIVDDTPIRDVGAFTIKICDLLGTDITRNDVAVYDLEKLSEVVMREQPRMAKTRAVERAAMTVAKLQLQHSQARKMHELGPGVGRHNLDQDADDREEHGRKKRKITARKVFGDVELNVGRAMSFAQLKKSCRDYAGEEIQEEDTESGESNGSEEEWTADCGV